MGMSAWEGFLYGPDLCPCDGGLQHGASRSTHDKNEVPRQGIGVSAWPADDVTPLDALTLESVKDAWGSEYDIGHANGLCLAYRLTGGDLLAADTPDGLESAIRADYSRWTAA